VSTRLIERAPAKVNLSLHILGRYENGWHELESLVAFAGCADLLTLETQEGLSLEVEGPTAAAAGPDHDNLVLRAARNLLRRAPNLRAGRFRLTKRLPAAAGLGGGSSDAAAALRLLARANGIELADERLFAAARETGADVPVCLAPRAKVMRGVGEKLGPPLRLPPLFAVLVNPGVAVETKAVFALLGLAPGQRAASPSKLSVDDVDSAPLLIQRLRAAGNDMESAACSLEPAVHDALSTLARIPGVRLARMSGSGATCFALFDSCRAAAAAATRVRGDQPTWWVKATALR
jgi:4-diphosphocytidyl-2-C-methyl-D-erythritol kinase